MVIDNRPVSSGKTSSRVSAKLLIIVAHSSGSKELEPSIMIERSSEV